MARIGRTYIKKYFLLKDATQLIANGRIKCITAMELFNDAELTGLRRRGMTPHQ